MPAWWETYWPQKYPRTGPDPLVSGLGSALKQAFMPARASLGEGIVPLEKPPNLGPFASVGKNTTGVNPYQPKPWTPDTFYNALLYGGRGTGFAPSKAAALAKKAAAGMEPSGITPKQLSTMDEMKRIQQLLGGQQGAGAQKPKIAQSPEEVKGQQTTIILKQSTPQGDTSLTMRGDPGDTKFSQAMEAASGVVGKLTINAPSPAPEPGMYPAVSTPQQAQEMAAANRSQFQQMESQRQGEGNWWQNLLHEPGRLAQVLGGIGQAVAPPDSWQQRLSQFGAQMGAYEQQKVEQQEYAKTIGKLLSGERVTGADIAGLPPDLAQSAFKAQMEQQAGGRAERAINLDELNAQFQRELQAAGVQLQAMDTGSRVAHTAAQIQWGYADVAERQARLQLEGEVRRAMVALEGQGVNIRAYEGYLQGLNVESQIHARELQARNDRVSNWISYVKAMQGDRKVSAEMLKEFERIAVQANAEVILSAAEEAGENLSNVRMYLTDPKSQTYSMQKTIELLKAAHKKAVANQNYAQAQTFESAMQGLFPAMGEMEQNYLNTGTVYSHPYTQGLRQGTRVFNEETGKFD